MKKIDRLKKWFFKSLGTDNEVGGCIKNEWVTINIQGNIAKEKNLFWEVGDSWKKCWHDSASVPQIWEFLAPPLLPMSRPVHICLSTPRPPVRADTRLGLFETLQLVNNSYWRVKKPWSFWYWMYTRVFLEVIQIVRSLRRGGGVIEKWTKTNRRRGS